MFSPASAWLATSTTGRRGLGWSWGPRWMPLSSMLAFWPATVTPDTTMLLSVEAVVPSVAPLAMLAMLSMRSTPAISMPWSWVSAWADALPLSRKERLVVTMRAAEMTPGDAKLASEAVAWLIGPSTTALMGPRFCS